MAKATIDTGLAAQPVHTRTTSDATESQAVVIAIDGSDSVVPASATSGLAVNQAALASATLANVASSATSVTLQASNANRRSWSVFNDSTAVMYIKFGATASATSYTVQVAANGYYEMPQPVYTGVIDGIWSAANGNARVCEGA